MLAMLVFSSASCGSDELPDRLETVSNPISGGTVDRGHEGVVAVAVQYGQSVALCTGTLIAPNLLLTARHCIAPTPDETVVCGESTFGETYDAVSVFFALDTTLGPETEWFGVREVLVPETPSDLCGADIALLISQHVVPEDQARPVVPCIDVPAQRLEPYAAVGYGVTSDAGNGAGTRRTRDGLRITCSGGGCGPSVTAAEFGGEVGICQGDSGGPALGQNGRVMGVASRGGAGCTTPVYSAVSAWSDFIRQGALTASLAGGYAPASWVLTGSTQSPLPPVSDEGGEPKP